MNNLKLIAEGLSDIAILDYQDNVGNLSDVNDECIYSEIESEEFQSYLTQIIEEAKNFPHGEYLCA